MNLARAFWQKLQCEDSRVILIGLAPDGQILWKQSRREILEEASRWMASLQAAGIGAGDRVALSLGKSSLLVPAQIAVLGVGGIVVPLNPSLSPREIQSVLKQAEARLVITRAETATACRESATATECQLWVSNSTPDDLAKGEWSLTEILARSQPGPEPIEQAGSELALLLFTSGTTGKPKGVGLTHGNLLSNLQALLVQTWEMTEEDLLLHALPPHHIHGLGLGIYGSLLVGNTILLLERFDAATVLKAISEHRAAIFMGVPTMYHRMLELEGTYDLSTMRLFISGSAPLPAEIFHRFQKRFGFAILERYGLTETVINTSNPPGGIRKPGSAGLPLPGIEVGVFCPESQRELRPGEMGEVWVRGPNVFPGYWREGEADQAAFCNGWFRTGDLGTFDADGYLYILGRKKELIIVGGTNVTPREVEIVLESEPGVAECAVAGLPDPDLGEKVAAFIVIDPDENPSSVEARLRSRAEKELAAFKRPRLYFFVDTIPRNAMGKVERSRLLIGR